MASSLLELQPRVFPINMISDIILPRDSVKYMCGGLLGSSCEVRSAELASFRIRNVAQ